MAIFTITTKPFDESHEYRVDVVGRGVSANTDLFNDEVDFRNRSVSFHVFHNEDDADDHRLQLSVAKLRGNMVIEIPDGWTIYTNTLNYNDFNKPLPQVVVKNSLTGAQAHEGFIATDYLCIQFEKVEGGAKQDHKVDLQDLIEVHLPKLTLSDSLAPAKELSETVDVVAPVLEKVT